jgi:hypothetical protein
MALLLLVLGDSVLGAAGDARIRPAGEAVSVSLAALLLQDEALARCRLPPTLRSLLAPTEVMVRAAPKKQTRLPNSGS